jgi:hypothetical protein
MEAVYGEPRRLARGCQNRASITIPIPTDIPARLLLPISDRHAHGIRLAGR